MKKILAIVLFYTTCSMHAQPIEGEIELAGFVLGQYRAVVYHQLGPPIQQQHTDDGWIYEFHLLKPDTSVYALFKYAQSDTMRIYSIQINGQRYEEMHPFRGLKLGARKEAVNRVFGHFDTTDTIKDPAVVIQYYPGKNYSVEIDKAGYLYG